MFQIPCYDFTHFQLFELAQKKLAENPVDWEKNVWNIVEQFCNPAINSLTFGTSGSTGKPKLITASKNHLQASAKTTVLYLQIAQRSNTLLCLPAEKIGGAMVIIRAIVQGLNLICVKPSSTPLEHIRNIDIHFASFTPMQFFSITQNPTHFDTAEKIGTVLLGGSVVSDPLFSKTKYMRNRVYATYGMTETLSHIALRKISHVPDSGFQPMPGVTLTTDTDNALIIDAPHLGVRQLSTNDLVKLYPNQTFEWVGRKDNIINTGGLKIIPETVEQKLKYIMPYPFFLAGLPDEYTGERVVLVIEQRELSTENVERLKLLLQKNLAEYERPRQFLLLPKFVRTETGKIVRKESLAAAVIYHQQNTSDSPAKAD
ncbi:MAG: AMP-binding protein [Chitinophagales bacterium]|nr:AMP-binding protein [Chitinophagales bacterium]